MLAKTLNKNGGGNQGRSSLDLIWITLNVMAVVNLVLREVGKCIVSCQDCSVKGLNQSWASKIVTKSAAAKKRVVQG